MGIEKMIAPKNVFVKKGWFPESASDCEEDSFCFVSLDTDLFEPIYQGLLWFYPRITPGGYIMIHDYNNNTYIGGGPRKILCDGTFGILTANESSRDFSEGIKLLCSDRSLREKLKTNGLVRAADFHPDVMGESWMDLLKKLEIRV